MSDPSEVLGQQGVAAAPASLLDSLLEHQTALIVAGVVLLHMGALVFLFASLWTQSPKQRRMARRFPDDKED